MTARRIILSPLAEDDLSGVATWTASNFGARQARAYLEAIIDTIEELLEQGAHPRSRQRNDIMPGLRSLHITKPGRRGRHLILYLDDPISITVLRILHDSMELSRHLPGHEDQT